MEQHFPERKEKVLNRLRELRGGRLSEPRFGLRMRGQGVIAEQVRDLFRLSCAKAGLGGHWPRLTAEGFRRPVERGAGAQLGLFE